MKELGIWVPLSVQLQTYKTAVETAVLLLWINDISQATKRRMMTRAGKEGLLMLARSE